jgi:hypothetical protein
MTAAGPRRRLEARLRATVKDIWDRIEGEKVMPAWEARTPTWPYTKIGLLLMTAIQLADEISDLIRSNPEPSQQPSLFDPPPD